MAQCMNARPKVVSRKILLMRFMLVVWSASRVCHTGLRGGGYTMYHFILVSSVGFLGHIVR